MLTKLMNRKPEQAAEGDTRRRQVDGDESSGQAQRDSNAKDGEAGDGGDQEKQSHEPAPFVYSESIIEI